jgi:hypothetical protein
MPKRAMPETAVRLDRAAPPLTMRPLPFSVRVPERTGVLLHKRSVTPSNERADFIPRKV